MKSSAEGHRSRLRQRFTTNKSATSDTDLLELLLIYAIPRRDVSGTAESLIQHYNSLAKVMAASKGELTDIEGVGEQSATLLQLVSEISRRISDNILVQPFLLDDMVVNLLTESEQTNDKENEAVVVDEAETVAVDGDLRAFVNDEVAHSQEYLPEAYRFQTLDDYRSFLYERLPYNAATTRRRRANHIIKRFFPSGSLNVVLVDFLRQTKSEIGRNSAIFYGLLHSEPLLMKVAEELIWPALAEGRVTREDLRTFILRYLPALSHSSQRNVLRSILTTYSQLGVATLEKDVLHVRQHPGDLDGFVYGLCVEFPQPGIYPFDSLERGLLRKGLLWDMAWMRRQLYLLHNVGIVAKVSEIDAVRQFTLRYEPSETLRAYFALDSQAIAVLRESSDAANNEYMVDNQHDG